jgi:hypothetical protein
MLPGADELELNIIRLPPDTIEEEERIKEDP